jgi:hypothetical protein
VGHALSEHGIRAILTGGACASLHAGGAYLSRDIDFILEGRVEVTELDAAMAAAGFARQANRYLHPQSPFWVEFPRGPLAVGADLKIAPRPLGDEAADTLALSPTDSCRDRLAAFYHWNDRQSLEVALLIAVRNEIDFDLVRRWSVGEGHLARYEEFRRELSRRPELTAARRSRA